MTEERPLNIAELARVVRRITRTDAQVVAEFLVGYWPGLEDGLPWGDEDAMNNHPALAAARRILGKDNKTGRATACSEIGPGG